MKAMSAFAIVVLLAASPGSGRGQHHPATPPSVAAAVAAADPAAVSVAPPGYRIGAGDMLHVAVWREPELTSTLPVRTDGKISVPLLNDVQAAGLTPMELSATLTAKLRKYISDPRVTVVVTQMNHERIYLVGEVARRGPMALLPDMTVFQALAAAAPTEFANTKKIYVLRSVGGVEQRLPVNYKRLLKGQGMAQNIMLKSGDTIVVP